MAVAAVKPAYKASFERTSKQKVAGNEQNVTDVITDPDDPRLALLIKDGRDGYLRVTSAETGERISGTHTSAITAQSVMRSIAKGTYNPFPKIRNKRRELTGGNA
jgi:hypothetical protein